MLLLAGGDTLNASNAPNFHRRFHYPESTFRQDAPPRILCLAFSRPGVFRNPNRAGAKPRGRSLHVQGESDELAQMERGLCPARVPWIGRKEVGQSWKETINKKLTMTS